MSGSRPRRPSLSCSSSEGEEVGAPLGDTPPPGTSEREKLQEKHEVAETPTPWMDKANGGHTLSGQGELKGNTGVEEDGKHEGDPNTEVREVCGKR